MTRAIGKTFVDLSEPSSATTSGNSRWLTWAPDKVDELLADLKTKKVVLLRADWTRRYRPSSVHWLRSGATACRSM